MVLRYIKKLFFPDAAPSPDPDKAPPPVATAGSAHHDPRIVRRPIPIERIDPDVVKIIHRLKRYGHTAHIVGGGVRDLLLARTPKDFDIGTSAQPEDVKRLFRNCRIIGRRFRLAHIFFQSKIIEVATFRANLPVEDAEGSADLLIKSDNVFGNPETDALRRDFTINALFYEPDTGNVIDYVGGLPDLDAHLMRTIGDPRIRFREDPIRILRALRLAGRLGFRIEDGTLSAIREYRHEIHKAATPRILEDIMRMLRGGGAESGFRGMRDTGVLAVVLPELDAAISRDEAAGAPCPIWKSLHAVDLAVGRGMEFTDSTLLAAALWPTARAALTLHSDADRGGARLAEAVHAALNPMETRLTIPRRERENVRHLLLAQQRFVEGRSGGRRFSPNAWISRPFFPEAFDLFEILVAATGEHRDDLQRWRERIVAWAKAHGGQMPQRPTRRGAEAGPRDGGRHGGRGDRGRGDRGDGRGDRDGGRRRRGRRGGGGGGEHRPDHPVFAEGPDRPDLSAEDVALIYGVALPPAGGAQPSAASGGGTSSGGIGGGSEQGQSQHRRRRRRGGRRHRRGGGAHGGNGSQGGESAAPGGAPPDSGGSDPSV